MADGVRPYTTFIQAISLEDTVKTKIYEKHLEADGWLQKVNTEQRTKNKQLMGQQNSEPEFEAAVLSEYRLIRPKLQSVDNMKATDELKAQMKKLLELDSLITKPPTGVDSAGVTKFVDKFPALVQAHLVIGEFLEADGITKYERPFRDLGSIMLERG